MSTVDNAMPNTRVVPGPVPVCVLDSDGCPIYLTCDHYWKRCGAGCPGWGGIELKTTPAKDARNTRLIAAGMMTTPATRAAASVGGAA